MKKILFILTLAAVTFINFSCDKGESQSEKDDAIIQIYIEENNLNMKKHSSGLYFQITETGTGASPNEDDLVEVKYKGYFLDGTVFDETTIGTSTFYLNQVIEGWQIGVQLLKEGGSGLFIIPSGLAYGSEGSGSVPPNTILIFEIELIRIR